MHAERGEVEGDKGPEPPAAGVHAGPPAGSTVGLPAGRSERMA